MSQRSPTRCPYTLKPLTDLPKVNDEHIFPHSIGGSKEYKVLADAAANSTLGSTADAAFVDFPLMAMLRNQHGVKSYSGVPDWKMEGVDTADGRAVKVSFPHDGPAEVRHKRPVEFDPATGEGHIIAPPGDSERLFEELKEKYRKKGMTIEVVNEERKEEQQVHVRMTLKLDDLVGGLAKIAYLAAFELLGDEFLDDPLNAEWQKAIRAATCEDFAKVKIHGQPFAASGAYNALLPALAPHQHAVSVCHMRQAGPVIAVKLFGSDAFSLICQASDTSTFGLRELEGRVAVCDALARKVTVEPFEDFFARRSGELPPPN